MINLTNGKCFLVAPAGATIKYGPNFVIYYKLSTSDLDARNKQTIDVAGSSNVKSGARMSVVTQFDGAVLSGWIMLDYIL